MLEKAKKTQDKPRSTGRESMVNMAAKRDAKKFVQLLAAKLSEGTQQLGRDDLEEYFRGSLETLPESVLKSTLQKNFTSYLEQLLRVVRTPKTNSRKTAKRENRSSLDDKKFNLFGRGALDEVLKSATQMSPDQRTVVYDHLWACYPFSNGLEKLFSILSSSKGDKGMSNLEDTLQAINKCKQVTIGNHTEESIGNCMKFFLSELSPWCEDCIKQPLSEETRKRTTKLKESIHSTVLLMHFRWQDCQRNVTTVHSRESYRDSMAAFLSLYIDMMLLSEIEGIEYEVKQAGNLVLHVLGHCPVHCMDVLLQSSALTSERIAVMLPIIKSIMKMNAGTLTRYSYIKYVLLARLCLVKGGDSLEDVADIRGAVEGVSAPPKFVSWLSSINERLKENLGLHRKMTGIQVTLHLLESNNDDALDVLLDIASEFGAGEYIAAEEDKQPNYNESELQKRDEQPLFFVDKSGDRHADKSSQVIKYEENEAEEKMLHAQLRSFFSQSRADSGYENENYMDDISTDDLPQKDLSQGLDLPQASNESVVTETVTDSSLDVHKKRKVTDSPQESFMNLELGGSKSASKRVKSNKTEKCSSIQNESILGMNDDQQKGPSEVHIQVVSDEAVGLVAHTGSSQEEEETTFGETETQKQEERSSSEEVDVTVINDDGIDMVVGRQDGQGSSCEMVVAQNETGEPGSTKLAIEIIDDKDVEVVVGNSQEEEDASGGSKDRRGTKRLTRTRTPKPVKKKCQTRKRKGKC